MLARYPGSSLQIFWSYNKVADSGGVVIQKQGSSTVDTRVPSIATTLFLFSQIGIRPPPRGNLEVQTYRNQIFPGGRHQGALRLLLPGLLLCIKSAISLSGMMQNKRCTSIMIACHQRAFEIPICWDKWTREARKRWRGEGGARVWWELPGKLVN